MKSLKDLFVSYCKKKKYKYECGRDYCDCNDFGEFVNVVVKGKTHTLYCMNDGTYRFDKTVVSAVSEIDVLLNGKKKED